jgi:DNA-directed RNA polymerase sigma subunit (sigma70/sigma32)
MAEAKYWRTHPEMLAFAERLQMMQDRGWSLARIGKEVGLSRERVRQILNTGRFHAKT